MRFFLRYWLPVIAWMALIFGASGDPNSVQHTDGILAQLFRLLHIHVASAQLETLRWFVRKCAHMTEYAVLAVLWWRALRATAHTKAWSGKTVVTVLVICILYAATDEFHQSFVKDRTPSAVDVCIDTSGAIIALGIVRLLMRRTARTEPA